VPVIAATPRPAQRLALEACGDTELLQRLKAVSGNADRAAAVVQRVLFIQQNTADAAAGEFDGGGKAYRPGADHGYPVERRLSIHFCRTRELVSRITEVEGIELSPSCRSHANPSVNALRHW